MSPALGCAAVPLLKKTLMSESIPDSIGLAAALGVRAAAATGLVVTAEIAALGRAVFDEPSADESFAFGCPAAAAARADFARAAAFDGPLLVAAPPLLLVGPDDPSWLVDFDDEPLEPPASAEATAGIAAIAAPKPNVMADAPTQLARRRWPLDDGSGPARPPNSAGSARSQELTVDFITMVPRSTCAI
jgi:hypothetical protein